MHLHRLMVFNVSPLNLLSVVVFLASFSAQAYMLDEVVIEKKAEEQSFFDTATLAELAKVDREELIDETALKLNDFFISSGIHFEVKDRFATLKPGYYPNTYLIPRGLEYKVPIFVLEMPTTSVFARAYLKFLTDNVLKMRKQIDQVYAQIQIAGPFVAINFKNFYACLRTISITSHGEMHQFPCLTPTIKSLYLKEEGAITELANTYMALYRASRISFVSPDSVNIKDEKILTACRTFKAPLIEIQIRTSSMIMLRQPMPSEMGTRKSREWDSAVSFYYTAPSVVHLLGPYVTVYGETDLTKTDSETDQRRLCLF